MKIQTVTDTFAKGSAYLRQDRAVQILDWAQKALFIWIIVFIISEIAISGGRYEFNPYLTAVQLVIILATSVYFISRLKTKPKTLKDTLFVGLSLAVSFAILDFLVINLVLEKNTLAIYRHWGTYAQYILLILIPLVQLLLKKRPQALTPPPPPENEIESEGKSF